MLGHRVIRNRVGNEITRDLDIAHLCRDEEVVRNNVEARCQVFQGELKQNVLLGAPLGAKKEEIDLAIMSTVETTYGVASISKFNSKMVNRTYSLSMIILTDFSKEVGVEV